ncbi:MAG: hypothetical protein NTW91_07055 [Verrucomicrobia bacterium]|jgi:hypothetical protein|nr:hypothetical protein [Verrucomicrobiota bacterium]
MSRKKKSQGIPPWLIGIVLVLISAGAYFIFQQGGTSSSLRTTEELNAEEYYKNANSLRGNTYKIDVEIDSALGNSPTKGRLFSVTLKQPGKNGSRAILPVLIPLELGSLTIQKGQHYLMKVKVIENGLLKVEEATKP